MRDSQVTGTSQTGDEVGAVGGEAEIQRRALRYSEGGQGLDGPARRPQRPEQPSLLPRPQSGNPRSRRCGPGEVQRPVGRQVVTLGRLFPDEDDRSSRVTGADDPEQGGGTFRGARSSDAVLGVRHRDLADLSGRATPAARFSCAPAARSTGRRPGGVRFAVTGELEVNPTLLQLLRRSSTSVRPSELLARADIVGCDRYAGRARRPSTAGLRTERAPCRVLGRAAVCLGTFSYAKLPMVKDLEGSHEAMLQHDLIAAIAGDDAARGTTCGSARPQGPGT